MLVEKLLLGELFATGSDFEAAQVVYLMKSVDVAEETCLAFTHDTAVVTTVLFPIRFHVLAF